MIIRQENEGDADPIHAVTAAAFQGRPYSSGTEAHIVDALRAAGVLTISLVAEDHDEIVGHVAFSPVTINGRPGRWYGLGPVSVSPRWQRRGIGTALITTGLAQLRALGAAGCVLLGDPAYYGRFGFVSDPALRYRDVDPKYFQWLSFAGDAPVGAVEYHPAFDVAGE
ncbi:MAG: N-acetyltransferase [Chloroflexota bacterium]|nr:N-acetyltransferase [Chloroflexota bacterium]